MMRASFAVACAAACGPSSSPHPGDAAPDCSQPAAHGVVDPCFGENGVTLTEAGTQQRVTSVLARYQPDGHIDPSFGGGLVVAQLPDSTATTFVYGATLAPDGSILVAGTAGATSQAAVVRFTAAGVLETSFGAGGVALFGAAGGNAVGVDVQADGSLLVAAGAAPATVEIARFGGDGTLDPAFGTAGVFSDPLTDSLFFPETAAFDGAGGVALAGQLQVTDTSDVDAGVAHYTSSFTHATSYLADVTGLDQGLGGTVLVGALGTTASGGLVAAGSHLFMTPTVPSAAAVYAAAITAAGTLDASYGTSGVFASGFGEAFASAQGGVVLGDGSLVLAGHFVNASATGASLYRLDAHGARDTTFGTAGEVEIAFPNASNDLGEATAIAIDSQGRYLVAGDVGSSWFVTRYWP